MRDPETDQKINVWRRFNVGFDRLLNGLAFTEQLRVDPGRYDCLTNSCINKVVGAGATAGIALPLETLPEKFGWDLYQTASALLHHTPLLNEM